MWILKIRKRWATCWAAAQTSLDERQNASDAGVGNGKEISRRETSY